MSPIQDGCVHHGAALRCQQDEAELYMSACIDGRTICRLPFSEVCQARPALQQPLSSNQPAFAAVASLGGAGCCDLQVHARSSCCAACCLLLWLLLGFEGHVLGLAAALPRTCICQGPAEVQPTCRTPCKLVIDKFGHFGTAGRSMGAKTLCRNSLLTQF